MRKLLFVILICPVFFLNAQEFDWFDVNLPVESRMDALIDAMTVEEKIGQLMNAAPGIDRLGVLPYNWWNECLHGVARTGRATVFPQAIGLGATFDPELIHQIATAISDEARAKFYIAQKIENYGIYAGLTFWSPNLNLFRDPRWGRGQETYGEDPYLISQIGKAFITGLQGEDDKYLKTAACAKHYVVHSGPETLRHEFDAVVSPKDLWETYMPAFKEAVTGARVEIIMGAYNRTNGESCSASKYLLSDVLRDKWGFTGHVVSDCGAIADIWRTHKLVETPEEAAALAIKSGLQLNCGRTFENLDKALEKGLITEADLDDALRILYSTRFKLGLFDPEENNPYSTIKEEVIESPEHVELARQAAVHSMVLVKNNNHVLPLDKKIRQIFVTGPQAANAEVLLGNYFGVSSDMVNFLEGITQKVSAGTTIEYKYGQLPFRKNVNPIDWATGSAAQSDVCIAFMGISGLLEGEEGEAIASSFKGDKGSIKLPQAQIDFIKKIVERKGDVPLILVITGGSPVAIPELFDFADAVIYTWYPGQQGGTALGDILFGNESPSGKLPFTIPYSVEDLPDYEDYSMKGRTYRYMEKEPQFPFGFGLSYTSFSLQNLQLDKNKLKKEENLTFSLSVSNESGITGEEVLQVYVSQNQGLENQPLYSLKAFQRVKLSGNERQEIEFSIAPGDLNLFNENGISKRFKGKYKLIVGTASPGARSKELGAVFVETDFELK